MKKTSFIILAITIFLAMPSITHAYSIKTENSIYVEKSEVIEGNLFAAGNNISIDGKVRGDVFCAGQNISINGEVEGDVICAGQTINVNGKVGGSVRVAGNSIVINSEVTRSLMAVGATVSMEKDANVGWEAYIAGAAVNMRGKVSRDLNCVGSDINIAGEVGQNVKAVLDSNNKNRKSEKSHLVIGKETVINGDLTYYDYQDASIDKDAKIKGKTERNEPKVMQGQKETGNAGRVLGIFYSVFTALVLGLVVISIWKKETVEIIEKMKTKPAQTIGWGAVVFFLTPIISIILLLTMIGIPLAFIIMLAWIIGLMIAKVFAGILVGKYFIENTWKEKKDNIFIAMICGIVIAWILFSIPFIGWLFSFIALLWGLGGIWMKFQKA